MKRTNVKKLIALLSLAAVFSCNVNTFASTPYVKYSDNMGNIMVPYNIAITYAGSGLELGSFGALSFYACTEVQGQYTAGVTVELQYYDGGWDTIADWSHKAYYAEVDNTYFASERGEYRVKSTHKAYNSSGNVVETMTCYSNVVEY